MGERDTLGTSDACSIFASPAGLTRIKASFSPDRRTVKEVRFHDDCLVRQLDRQCGCWCRLNCPCRARIVEFLKSLRAQLKLKLLIVYRIAFGPRTGQKVVQGCGCR